MPIPSPQPQPQPPTPHTFTIPRALWLHGEGGEASKLYRPADGKQCCVGHYLTSCGVEKESMEGVGAATILRLPIEALWLRSISALGTMYSSPAADGLYYENDKRAAHTPDGSMVVNEEDREAAIIKYFAKQNVTVTFSD